MTTVKEEIIDLDIRKKDLLRIAAYHNTSCISIYMPTHRAGVEALNGQDAISLKNKAKEIKTKLISNGMTSNEIERLLNPVMDLVEDPDFWRHQSNGLVIFTADGFFAKYTVPISFIGRTYLSSDFYITPLIPLFNITETYILLTLKKDGARLYEGNKFGLSEIDIEGLIPSRIEDSVGYDYEQKQLQFRTQLGGNKPGSFHGHGESESRNKNELLTYFREIDKGITQLLHDRQDPPLIICCIDYYYPIFREACTYNNLYKDHLSINPADLDIRQLHSKAWKIIAPFFKNDLDLRKEKYMIGHVKGKSSSDIREIVPAAVMGKIDTLFINTNADIFGVYDPENNTVIINEEHTLSNASLINLTAKKVFEQGGFVYLLENHEMPDGSTDINALFRY